MVETFDVTSPSAGLTVSGATLSIAPSNRLADSASYYVEIDATAIDDISSNSFAGVSGESIWSFSTAAADATAPTNAFQSPRPGATGVNPAANLILIFDEPVAFGSGAIHLRQSGGALIQSFDVGSPGDGLSLNEKALTINPSADLSDATTYYLEIDATAIDDLAGNSFGGISGSNTWSFTTIVPDVTAPDIVSTIPASGSSDFFPANNLFVTFDEWIALGTGFIHIRTSDGTLVESFDVTDPASGLSTLADTVTINPSSDLPLGTNFYIEIESTAILDNAGNYYPGTVGSTTWNFSVSASVDYTTITHIGTQFDIEAGTNDLAFGWRNPSPVKPLDIDGDNILGTDGYRTSDRTSDPSYAITAKRAPNANGGGKVYDDPTNPSGDDIGLAALHDANAGNGQESVPLLEFEITQDLPEGTTLRVGILFDLITVSTGTNTATYTLKQTFGGTATATTPAYQWTGETMDVAYFDLTNVRATHKYVITSTTISTPNHPGPFEQVIGVTFDTGTTGPDETPPAVSARDPAHAAVDVSPTTNLAITFDEDVAFGTGHITLRQSGGALVESFDVANPPAGLSLSGNTVTINPTDDLAFFTTYYIEIDGTAIDDLAGNSFAGFSGDGTWSFTTIEPDITNPEIHSLSPANGAGAVAPTASLTITFTEDIAFGTGSILLRESGGAEVESFDVANPPTGLSLSGASVTITPTSNLTASTTYYVEIPATAIDDLAGNSFAGFSGSGTWSFTTVEQLEAARFDYGGSATPVQADFTQVSDPIGTATNNGITIASSPDFEFRDRTTQINNAGFGSDPLVNLLSDIAFENDSSSITFTLTGLAPLAEYAVVGYAYDADFSNDSVVNDWTTSGGTVSHGWLHDDITTARFEMANLTADESGQATIIASYNVASIIIWNGFEIAAVSGADTTPPALTSTDPVDQTVDVSPTQNLVVTFNEDIAPGSGGVTIKNLTDATESVINVTDGTQISISAATLTINPTNDLTKGKNYAVQVANTAIEDTSGNAWAGISNDTIWRFSTVAPTFTEWINEFDNLAGLTAFVEDPDGDGISNGVEYYFGTNPGEDSRGLAPGEVIVSGNTTFTFTHPLRVPPSGSIAAAYRWSTDLFNFQDSGVSFEGTTVTFSPPGSPDTEGITTVTATITGSLVDRLFVNLHVTQN